MPPEILAIENITKRFGSRTAVHALSFTVRRGEVFALLGPNGAGKTTCVRMLTARAHGTSRPGGGALSKGNQQRVQLIAAVLHRPALAILDVPFTGLDPVSQEFFLDLVRDTGAVGDGRQPYQHRAYATARPLRSRRPRRRRTPRGGPGMNHPRQALLVAGWEFGRYFKWRDQLMGLLTFLLIGGAGYVAGRLVSSSRTLTIGVEAIDHSALAALGPSRRLTFVPAPAESRHADALREGPLSGILTRLPDGSFALAVEKDPRYRGELTDLLDELVRRERLSRLGLAPQDLQLILEPAHLQVVFTNPVRGRVGRGEQLVAGIGTAIVMLAIFIGRAYLLTGITGEKQLRVTESIISIVSPQAWIDGKILGIAAYSLVNVVNMAVGLMIVGLVAGKGWGFSLPDAAVRPGILLLMGVYCALGLLVWNAAFSAFAATIDDPNTSARTSVMFLPVLFVGAACWIVLRNPDSTVSRALAIFPLTSAPALPVRAILSDPGAWEIVISLAALLATIWVIRRAAGRIFEIGMLMYGKEPSLREMIRWARAPARRPWIIRPLLRERVAEGAVSVFETECPQVHTTGRRHLS